MIQFGSERELFDWIDERMRETQSTRNDRAHYANRNRARYNGFQWLARGTGMDSALKTYYGIDQDWSQVYQSNEPMKTTVNRTTAMVQQSASSTNWTGMEVITQESPVSVGSSRYVEQDLYESLANITADSCRLQQACQRANLERCIDAMHGVGIKIQKSDANGTTDYNLRSFDFDGYQLSIDPTNKSLDLRDHEYVMLSEVLTYDAAKRDYGDLIDKIKKDDLKTLAQLLPNEVAHMALSGGTMYTHLQQATGMKALRIVTLWVKGPGRRFDRMYTVADGVSKENKVALNFEDPTNPYGACGMPLQCFYGYMRPGEVFGISDVGMMADDQDRMNLAATLYWQQVYDFTTNVVYAIDKGWFGQSRVDDHAIIEKVRQGYLIGQTNGVARFNPPQMLSRPAPSQQLLGDMQAHESGMRKVIMQTPLHGGEAKTHIADSTHQLTVELAEGPIEDRRETDIRSVSALIEVATATMLSMVIAQAPTAIAALDEAGMNQTEIGELMGLNPLRPPAKLVVARESVRRRSKGQMKRDLIALAQVGAHQDPLLRGALAALDFPIVETDKATERWANRAVRRVIAGEPYNAVPLGAMSETALQAVRRGMQSDEARNPDVYARLLQAYQLQMQMDMMQGMVPGEGEEQGMPEEVDQAQASQMLGL